MNARAIESPPVADGRDLDFRGMLEIMPAAAYTCSADGLITYFNRRAVQVWGRSPRRNDPADRYCGSFRLFASDGSPIPHDDCWMARCLREHREYAGEEIVIERMDGSRVTVEAHATPLLDEQGHLTGAVNVLVDVTDLRRTQERLRRSEHELADFFENGVLALHWVGPDGIILRANRTELSLLGYTRDEYVGHHIAEFHADREAICDMLRRLEAGEELLDYEARLRCKDGSIRHVQISSNVLFDDGKFIHTRCFTRDVTERKQTEQALHDTELQLEAELSDARLLQEISAQLIGAHDEPVLHEKLVDTTQRIMQSDAASMQVLYPERGTEGELRLLACRGFSPEAARLWEWVGADSHSSCGAALRSGRRVIVRDVERCDFMAGTVDLQGYRAAGIRAVQTTPLLSRSGKTVGMISTHWREPHDPSERELRMLDVVARQAADVVERRHAQEALRQREERLRAIFDSAAIGAAILTRDMRIIQVNGAFSTITGYSIQELRALDCRALTHPDDWAEMQAQLDALLAGRTPSFVIEKRYLRKDGSLVWVQNSVSMTRDASGEPLHLVKLCQDITERRQAQEALSLSNTQLRLQAEELARFNRAAVDRELRMIELKKAINALSEQLGDRPPHPLAFETDARAAND